MSDSRALAPSNGENGALAQRGESSSLIAMILEAARDPAVDAAKVETMAGLAMKLQDRERESQFNRDLNAAIMDMPIVTKAGIIVIPAKDNKPARTQGRFARFEDIDRVCRPILQRHNLAIRFEVDDSARGVVSVRPILSHSNGHTERGGAMSLPIDDSGAKNKVQGVGSAVQYGKRYTYCALLNIVTEGTDDDGSLGRLSIEMPHERADAVLEEAEAAAEAGTYAEFFSRQGVKDRAWLVSSGHHSRLGGDAALPGSSSDSTPTPSPSPARQERREPPKAEANPQLRAEVDQYKRGLRGPKVKSLDGLIAFNDRSAKWLGWLRDNAPELHRECSAASSAREAELLSASPDGADRSSANGPAGHSADAGPLFPEED